MSRPRPTAPALARRMAPLALVAALLVGVALPMIYQRLAVAERAGEATVWAQNLAGRIEQLTRARPQLWAFDEITLAQLTTTVTAPPILAAVRIDAADTERAYESGPDPGADAVSGWAIIQVHGRAEGRVQVRLGAASAMSAARRLWVGAIASGTLLGLALFLLPWIAIRRADASNGKLWDALEEANIHLEARVNERTAELRELGNRLVAVQEEERARISRDLHDDLGQTLTALRLRLTALEPVVEGQDPRGHLDAALVAVDAGVDQIRRLAHNLRPAALDGLGAIAALIGHAERWAEVAGIELVIEVTEDEPPSEVGEVLFRVAQEALTNVARHAEATQVSIKMGPFDDGWRLQVIDDGRGLKSKADGERVGLGLVGARERIDATGGYLDVESAEPSGVMLTAWIPADYL